MANVDVVIIGAGLTGSMTARSLAARDQSVVVLEAREPGHSGGSSHGSSRGYRRGQTTEKFGVMADHAYRLWRGLEVEAGASLLRMTGALDFGNDREPDRLLTTFQHDGVHAELFDPAAAGRRWPQLRFPTSVVFHPAAGILDPEAAIRAALDSAARRGAEIRTNTEVTSIEPIGSSALVHTASTTYRARHVVIAAGPWLPGFLESSVTGHLEPRLTVSRQSVFHFPTRDGSDDWPLIICKHDGRQFYALPSGRDTGDTATIKIGLHDLGPRATPDVPGSPDPAALRHIQDFVRAYVPGLHPEPVRADTCFYTSTSDENFLIDRSGPVTVASPCSGQGAKFAPLVGEMVADIALGNRDPDPAFQVAAVR
jgi:monomeric sarcosine oxidase